MKLGLSIILLLISSFISTILFSQDIRLNTEKLAKVDTKDGSSILGKIIDKDKDYITIKTQYGENRIKISDITKTSYIDEDKYEIDKEEREDTYSASHYYFTQSAFNLKKGQMYYENVYLAFNSITYGVTDHFSITGGVEIVSLLFEGQFPISFITPKVSLPFKGGAFSLSTSLAKVPGESAIGVFQSGVTFGDLTSNITLSAGVGYSFDGPQESIVPITFSGMAPLSDNVSLMTENWLFISESGGLGVFSLGLRIFGKRNNNFISLSLLRPTEDIGDLIALPFFSGTVAIK